MDSMEFKIKTSRSPTKTLYTVTQPNVFNCTQPLNSQQGYPLQQATKAPQTHSRPYPDLSPHPCIQA